MSSGKFGLGNLVESAAPPDTERNNDISSRLAGFPKPAPRVRINPEEVDAAAAPHGFVSREPQPPITTNEARGRRKIPKEQTTNVGMQVPDSDYERFRVFANRHGVPFYKALGILLDIAEGKR